MCGIAVAIDWDGAEAAVRCLIAGMLHRGDVTDPLVMVGNDVAMCTRRLRIVDAARGTQPQASFDERFLVSLNGEIYNHADLRRELEALGVHFRTECDTEVVANVLRAWGQNGIKRLAGMYAFVAVDTATGEFLAARDPFGVKPLYRSTVAQGLFVLLGNPAVAGRDRGRRRPIIAPRPFADPQFLRAPLQPAITRGIERCVTSGPGPNSIGSRAHPYAVKPTGRCTIQRRHR